MSIDEMLDEQMPFDEIEIQFRRMLARKAMKLEHNNQCRAAELLRVHRNTFNRMLHGKKDTSHARAKAAGVAA